MPEFEPQSRTGQPTEEVDLDSVLFDEGPQPPNPMPRACRCVCHTVGLFGLMCCPCTEREFIEGVKKIVGTTPAISPAIPTEPASPVVETAPPVDSALKELIAALEGLLVNEYAEAPDRDMKMRWVCLGCIDSPWGDTLEEIRHHHDADCAVGKAESALQKVKESQ